MEKNNELNLVPVILLEQIENQLFEALEMVLAFKTTKGYQVVQGYCSGMILPSIFDTEDYFCEFCCLECSMKSLLSLGSPFDLDAVLMTMSAFLEDSGYKLGLLDGNICKIYSDDYEEYRFIREKMVDRIPLSAMSANDLVAELYLQPNKNLRKRI